VDAPDLMEQEGADAVQKLWDSVSRDSVQWLHSLHFGFHELDCLLIHGSTVSYADELTPDTPAIELLDRLIRADANHLFCGRSGLMFECWLEPKSLHSTITSLDQNQEQQDQQQSPRRIIGVGNVGRQIGQGTYTLYNSATNEIKFERVYYGAGKGFG